MHEMSRVPLRILSNASACPRRESAAHPTAYASVCSAPRARTACGQIADTSRTLAELADKIALTGKKWDDKKYIDHSLFPGGIRENSAKQLLKRHPTSLVERAVWGMLPKGPLGRRLYKKLKVYAGDKHPHAAQQPKVLEIK